MTRKQIVLKLEEEMKKHNRPADEIDFERKNISNWWNVCKSASIDDLKGKEDYLRKNLESAKARGDVAYHSCRGLFLKIVYNFLPPDIPF